MMRKTSLASDTKDAIKSMRREAASRSENAIAPRNAVEELKPDMKRCTWVGDTDPLTRSRID